MYRMYTPETGGILNRMVHFYAYESLDHRDKCRKAMLQEQQWSDFLQRSRPYVLGPQVIIVILGDPAVVSHAEFLVTCVLVCFCQRFSAIVSRALKMLTGQSVLW